MSAPAAGQLVDQARALEHPLPIPGASGLWGLEYGSESKQVTQAQLDQIRAGFSREVRRGLSRANVTIAGGVEGHRSMIQLHEDQYVVSRVSDVFGGVSLPDLSIWDPAYAAMWRAQAELRASQLSEAARAVEEAQVSSQRAMDQYVAYREGVIGGAGRSVTTLEWTRDIAFAIDGILATIVTGGAGGVLIGTALTASGTAAQQAMEVNLDMRRAVDWRGIGVDAALSVLLSLLGGKIADKVLRNPATASVGRRVVTRIVKGLLLGSAQTVVQTTLRTIIDNLSGDRHAMNGEQLAATLVHQLTDPKSIFMNLLQGELSEHIGAAMAQKAPERGAGGGQEQAQPVHDMAAPAQEAVPLGPEQVMEGTTAPDATPVAGELATKNIPDVPVPDQAPFGPQSLEEPSGLELDTQPTASFDTTSPEAGAVPLQHDGPSGLELDPTRSYERPTEDRIDLRPPPKSPAKQSSESAPFGPQTLAEPSGLALDRDRKGPRNPKRTEFGPRSQERTGSEHRAGEHFREWNAAEIERGLRIETDAISGEVIEVTYRVDPDIHAAPGSDPRSYTKDSSTHGAQSSAAAFSNTGYDLGHLAQLEAFKNGAKAAQEAANQMTNLVPMRPGLNRGVHDSKGVWQPSEWRTSEQRTVHDYAKTESVIVKVKPIYPETPARLSDGTPIPSAVRRQVLRLDGTVIEDKVYANQ